jgi:hypothetical protein
MRVSTAIQFGSHVEVADLPGLMLARGSHALLTQEAAPRWNGLLLSSIEVVEVTVESDPSCGSTPRSAAPTRTDRDRSVRASRWKQLLVAVHDAIAVLHVRLRREPAATLTGRLETEPATRGRDPGEAWHTSLPDGPRDRPGERGMIAS